MPTININRKVFEELSGKKLPDDKLKERISMMGTAIESADKKEIVTEIFPNRPDMLSVQGFSRAFSSFIGVKTGIREYNVKPSGEKVIIDKSVKGVRPYTACAIVKGIEYTDERIKEVIQIQEKLHITFGRNRRKIAIGIYPYEKIVPPIRFLAKKPEEIIFRPLEYPKKIDGRQILAQHPAGKEYAHLLEGMEKYPIFVDSKDSILSMPPIINSHDVGKISGATKDVFIECSGSDFPSLKKCLNIIVTAMADMGGKIYSMELTYPDSKVVTPNLSPEKMKVDIGYINKRLGIELTQKELKKLFGRMGYSYDEKAKVLLVPCYRTDILHQIDLAEDIAIAYGYENITGTIPKVATTGKEDDFEIFRNRVHDVLAGLGLMQINTYNLTNRDYQAKLMEVEDETVPLANSVSLEYDALRAWITPSMLECLKGNKQHDYPQRIFTSGQAFRRKPRLSEDDSGIDEMTMLSVAVCSDRADFTEIKQVLDYLMHIIGLKYSISEAEHNSYIPGRVGKIVIESGRAGGKKGDNSDNTIGYIGEISPKVLRNWSLEMPVALFELNLLRLFEITAKS